MLNPSKQLVTELDPAVFRMLTEIDSLSGPGVYSAAMLVVNVYHSARIAYFVVQHILKEPYQDVFLTVSVSIEIQQREIDRGVSPF